jgi:hypothetical protein
MDKFLIRIKERWDLYFFFAVIVGAVFMKVWGVGDKVDVMQTDITEVKQVQQQLIEEKVDSDMLDAKLDPIKVSNADLKREIEIAQANINGLRVENRDGAIERTAQLEGRMIVIQNMVYNNTITAVAAVESLTVLSREIDALREIARPDTVVQTKIDTLRVPKEKKHRRFWFDG